MESTGLEWTVVDSIGGKMEMINGVWSNRILDWLAGLLVVFYACLFSELGGEREMRYERLMVACCFIFWYHPS